LKQNVTCYADVTLL